MSTTSTQGPSLLLLEFVTAERWVFDSRYFPFVKGLADANGFTTRWLCFGTSVEVEKTGPSSVRTFVELEDEALELLRATVSELAPTHVIFSHPLSDAIMASLTAGGTSPALLSTADQPVPRVESVSELVRRVAREAAAAEGRSDVRGDGSTAGAQARADWMAKWLGLGEDAVGGRNAWVVGSVSPTYDAVMANERALTFSPHVTVLGGVTCDHSAKLADNPYYQGLDLSDCDQDWGCGYCTWYRRPTSDIEVSATDTAVLQLRRLAETSGADGRHRGVVDLLDIRVLAELDQFAAAVGELGLPPTRFCIEPRIDRVLEIADRLDGALAALGAHGHSLCLLRMGLENLDEEENTRFNKGISVAQIDACTKLLADLRQQHPDTFDHDPTWAYLTCSPWTTLDMFGRQIERAIERGFEPLGIWLYTPVFLYRGAPIVVLAEADGEVLVDEFEDISLLYEASVNGVAFDTLQAWRFKDDRMASAFALVVRFCASALRGKYSDAIFGGDDLYAALLAEQEDTTTRWDRPDIFARAAVETIADSDEGAARTDLLARAVARYKETVPAPVTQPTPGASGSPEASGDRGSGRDDAAAEARRQRSELLQRVAAAVVRRFGKHFADVDVIAASALGADETLGLSLEIEGTPYELRLEPVTPDAPFFHRGQYFGVSHAKDTPLSEPKHQRLVRDLLAGVEKVASGQAKTLLPTPTSSADLA